MLIKDNIDTADRMQTTAGSLALADSIAPRDAFLVERLRAAGAVILGKTNLSEWANFRSTRSTSGWSGRGGQTRNPYALDRNPCGSSSGSGAAAAANLAALAVGTETDGSIICPATACGLVGIKPTVGLVSRAGIIPISASQDTAGPMTRTVADAAALLSVLAGVDPRDPATSRADGKVQADYTAFLQADALKGARIGVVRNMFGENAQVGRVIDEALAALKGAGAELVDPVEMKQHREVGDAEFTVLLYEFKDGLNAYLASLGEAAPYRTLEQLIAFNDAAPGPRHALVRPGDLRHGPGEGRPRREGVSRRRREVPPARRRGRASIASWTSTGSTRWWRRPATPRSRPTWSMAITTPAAARRRCRRWRAIRTSRFRRARCSACRSACRSSVARGANRA